MSREKGRLTTADYLPIKEFNRLVDGLHSDGLYMWELYCRLSFCIEKKTSKARRITFNDSVRQKIKELYTLQGEPNKKGSPFLNPKTQTAYSLEHINRLLKRFKVRYRLPIKAFSTHTFRKTFGRYVYESNGRSAESLILLNSIFRHSSIDITKVYIGLRQAEIDQIYKSIKF